MLTNNIVQKNIKVSGAKKRKLKNNLDQRLLKLFDNQYGIVIQVYDEIVHCIGMPNVKIGEIVMVQDHVAKRAYKGLVINIS